MPYIPLDHFQTTDDDLSSVRIRDMPYGKHRESLSIYPETLIFEGIPVNTISPPHPVIITNNGYDIVIITDVKIVGEFTFHGTVSTLAPGEQVSLQVFFTPKRDGTVTGGIYLNSGNAAGMEFITLSGSTVGSEQGAWWIYDPIRSNTLWNPTIQAEIDADDYFGYPPAEEPDKYFNIVIAHGFKGFENGIDIVRSTLVGHAEGEFLRGCVFTDVFGADAMKFAKWSNRNTCIGTLTGAWFGQDLTSDTSVNSAYPPGTPRYYEHEVMNNNGFTYDSPGWNAFSLKTKSPGSQQRVIDWVNSNPWCDNKAATLGGDPDDYILANVLVGRDAMNMTVAGRYNTAIGYRSLGLLLEGSFNTALGYNAGFSSTIGAAAAPLTGNVYLGAFASQFHQDGNFNVSVGYNAGNGVIHGIQNVCIGSGAGAVGADPNNTVDVTMNRCVFIGAAAGHGITSSLIQDKLYIGNYSLRGPLIAGDFLSNRVAVGDLPISPTMDWKLKGGFTVYRGDSQVPTIATGADEIVIETNTAAGMTFATPNTAVASIFFADPQDISGYIQYSHVTNTLTFGANSVNRFHITGTGMGFNGSAAVTKPTVTGAKGSNAALASLITALASYGLITDTTTA